MLPILFAQSRRRQPIGRKRRRGLAIQPLEPRLVLATFAVNTTDDTVDVSPGDGAAADANGMVSLRAAVMEANATFGDDTILLPAGMYELTRELTTPGVDSDADLDLDVTDSSGTLTIVGDGMGSSIISTVFSVANEESRIFDVLNSVLFLEGVSLRDASTTMAGGAIRSFASTIGVQSSELSGNSAILSGGAIYGAGVTLDVRDSVISGNSADSGSAIQLRYSLGVRSQAYIGRSTFESNQAFSDSSYGLNIQGSTIELELSSVVVAYSQLMQNVGGGIQGSSSTVQVRNTDIIDNDFGVANDVGDTAIMSSVISGNTLFGGIVSTYASSLRVADTLVSDNGATANSPYGEYAGGITVRDFIVGNPEIDVLNTTIRGNAGQSRGGGLEVVLNNPLSQFRLVNSTVSGNTATSEAGGMYLDLGSASGVVRHATITDNVAPMDAGLVSATGFLRVENSIIAGSQDSSGNPTADVSGDFDSNGFNLVEDPGGAAGGFSSDITSVAPALSPLGDHGGLVPTRIPLAGSPVIDAGETLVLLDVLSDQRRAARGFDANGSALFAPDLGATEYTPTQTIQGIVTRGGTAVDGQSVQLYWDMNQDGVLDSSDVAIASTATDSLGAYAFQVDYGDYLIEVDGNVNVVGVHPADGPLTIDSFDITPQRTAGDQPVEDSRFALEAIALDRDMSFVLSGGFADIQVASGLLHLDDSVTSDVIVNVAWDGFDPSPSAVTTGQYSLDLTAIPNAALRFVNGGDSVGVELVVRIYSADNDFSEATVILGASLTPELIVLPLGSFISAGINPADFTNVQAIEFEFRDSVGSTTSVDYVDVISQDQPVQVDFALFQGQPGLEVVSTIDGSVADTAPGPSVPAGFPVTIEYQVSGIDLAGGPTPVLQNVVITIDNATPADTSDDVTAVFVSGDDDGDLLLDATETWIFAAPVDVIVGPQVATATVTADVLGSAVPISATNEAFYTGYDPLIVTNTNDSGPGSLRAAIEAANQLSDGQTITFAIPASDAGFIDIDGPSGGDVDPDVFVIDLLSPLPELSDTSGGTFIAAETQQLLTGDSNPVGPEVVLNGSNLGSGNGLVLSTDNNRVSGLVIHGFSQDAAIRVSGSFNEVYGNYVGTDALGTTVVANRYGVFVSGTFNTIGTTGASLDLDGGNLISGNVLAGVSLGSGLSVGQDGNNVVQNNRIGTDRTGTSGLGNEGPGVAVFNRLETIGGDPLSLVGNISAFNLGPGVLVGTPEVGTVVPSGVAIRGNSIHSNVGLGIDLSTGIDADGVTPNDPDDSDDGPNGLLNFPEITNFTASDQLQTLIEGQGTGAPQSLLTLDFFANTSPDATGNGEGQRYLGSTDVLVASDGTYTFSVILVENTSPSDFISATATDVSASTSEFSVSYSGAFLDAVLDVTLNGQATPTPPGPIIAANDTVAIEYAVTNTGTISFDVLSFVDDATPGIAGGDRAIAFVGGDTNSDGLIDPGETWQFMATETAVAGQQTTVVTFEGGDLGGGTISLSGATNYFGLDAGIDIEKSTTGIDADDAPGPSVIANGTNLVTWRYEVTNTGGLALHNITVSDDQGVVPQFVSGDTNGDGVLDLTEVWIYQASGLVQAGAYANEGTATGEVVQNGSLIASVTDTDPSHYFGVTTGIEIQTSTNGEDADNVPGVILRAEANAPDTVTWRYRVINTSNAPIDNVTVADDQGVVPQFVSGDVNGDQRLDVNEVWIYEASGVAQPGQYTNNGTVTGEIVSGGQVLETVSDSDSSHYFGVNAIVSIETLTNGEDADAPPGPLLTPGDTVTWDYIVSNAGNVSLVAVSVTDDHGVSTQFVSGDVNGDNRLSPGETWRYTASSTVTLGLYMNIGSVVASVEGPTGADLGFVMDSDVSHHQGGGATIEGNLDNDLNRNGVKDIDEPGIAGTIVFLDVDNDGQFDSSEPNTATDAAGHYQFTNLVAGDYQVGVVIPDGASYVAPFGGLQSVSMPRLGLVPRAAVTLDMDADGDLDLAVTNDFSGTVTLLENDGAGNFSTFDDVAVGNRPQALAAVDVDRDGRLELVVTLLDGVTGATSGAIRVLRGDGTGHYAIGQTVPLGAGPIDLTSADFNGDGFADLAVANFRSDSATILLNDGRGTFVVSQAALPAGAQPDAITSGDVDGDGDSDLVVASYTGNQVVLVRNNGTGVFEDALNAVAVNSPSDVRLGDLDDDGHLDLAVADYLGDQVKIFYGNGNGTWSDSHVMTLNSGSRPESVKFADMNGDRRLDLIVAASERNEVATFSNMGDRTMADPSIVSTSAGPEWVVIDHLNKDGNLDLATADVSGTASLLLYRPQLISVTVGPVTQSSDNDFLVAMDAPASPTTNAPASQSPLSAVSASSIPARHHVTNPADVNEDGVVSPLDALAVVNVLGDNVPLAERIRRGATNYLDVNNDNRVSPLDALRVINFLASPGTARAAMSTVAVPGETQSRAAVPADVVLASWTDVPAAEFKPTGTTAADSASSDAPAIDSVLAQWNSRTPHQARRFGMPAGTQATRDAVRLLAESATGSLRLGRFESGRTGWEG